MRIAEPPRNSDLGSLDAKTLASVTGVIADLTRQGFDPVVFEARRSVERQEWLYGIGRTHDLKRKPVTWTLKSKHLGGKAVDIISKSKGWSWPKFFVALGRSALKHGMHQITNEQCHIQRD